MNSLSTSSLVIQHGTLKQGRGKGNFPLISVQLDWICWWMDGWITVDDDVWINRWWILPFPLFFKHIHDESENWSFTLFRPPREETTDVTSTDVDTPSLFAASTATAVALRTRPSSVSPSVTWLKLLLSVIFKKPLFMRVNDERKKEGEREIALIFTFN